MFNPYYHIASVLPAVKSITGDFFRIRFICLWSTERAITEIPDQDEIDSADKDAGVREPVGNRFIVSAGMLHAGFGFAVKVFDLFNKSIDSRLGWRMLQGGIRTTSPGLRVVIVLLPLEISIPTVYCWRRYNLLERHFE